MSVTQYPRVLLVMMCYHCSLRHRKPLYCNSITEGATAIDNVASNVRGRVSEMESRRRHPTLRGILELSRGCVGKQRVDRRV